MEKQSRLRRGSDYRTYCFWCSSRGDVKTAGATWLVQPGWCSLAGATVQLGWCSLAEAAVLNAQLPHQPFTLPTMLEMV
jgi:hypothetical protein